MSNHNDNKHKENMNQKQEIQNRHGPQLRLLQITLGGPLDALDHIKQLMTPLGDERLDVKGEASLELPESLEAEGPAEGNVGDEEPGVASEGDAKEGGEGGDAAGEDVAFGLEIGGLDGGRGGGDGVVEVEEGGGEGEEEIGGERE